MRAILRDYSVNWGIVAFMLLYAFAPRAYGGLYIALFFIVLLSVAYLIFKSIKIMQFNGILIVPNVLFFLMALITLSVTISLTLNAALFTPIGLSDIAMPFVFMTFFVFGVSSNLKYSIPEIKKTLVLVSKVIIIGQFIVTIDQIFSIDVFSVLYDYGKTSSTGDIVSFRRSTGTFYNPNIFAWNILQCGIIIHLFSRKTNRFFWLFLCLLLIFLSGSKSIIAAFPIGLLIAGWLKGERGIVNLKNIYVIFAIAILIFSIYQFLIAYPKVFPRLMVLIQLLSGEDDSGGGRFKIWENAYAYFLSKENGVISWVFGMGPIDMFKTLDNGYLYKFFRHGVIGLFLHVTLLVYLIVKFYKFEDRELGAMGVQYILIGAITQLIVDGFAGWSYSIHLFLYAGLVYSYEYRQLIVTRLSYNESS